MFGIFNMSGLYPGMNMSGMNMSGLYPGMNISGMNMSGLYPGMNISGMNMSGLPPMPVISLNFSNMTEQEMYSWA